MNKKTESENGRKKEEPDQKKKNTPGEKKKSKIPPTPKKTHTLGNLTSKKKKKGNRVSGDANTTQQNRGFFFPLLPPVICRFTPTLIGEQMKPIGKNKKERGRKRGRVIVPSQRLKMCTPHTKKKKRELGKRCTCSDMWQCTRGKKKEGRFSKSCGKQEKMTRELKRHT